MRSTTRLLALGMIALLSGACGKKLTGPATQPAGGAQAKAAKGPETILTDAKLSGFAAYRRQMIPMNKLAMGLAVGAFNDGAKSAKQMANALTAEERLKRLGEASDEALKNAGITREDVSTLTPILTPYYVQRSLALESESALAAIQKRKADGGKPQPADDALAEVHQKELEKVAELRAGYETKYGAAALEALDQHEKEFIELGRAELESVLGK